MHHAMMAPDGPVAAAKVRGREKIHAPTMKSTTKAVSANKDGFRAGCGVISSPDIASRQEPVSFGWEPGVKLDRLQFQRSCSLIKTLLQGRIPIFLAHSR